MSRPPNPVSELKMLMVTPSRKPLQLRAKGSAV